MYTGPSDLYFTTEGSARPWVGEKRPPVTRNAGLRHDGRGRALPGPQATRAEKTDMTLLFFFAWVVIGLPTYATIFNRLRRIRGATT